MLRSLLVKGLHTLVLLAKATDWHAGGLLALLISAGWAQTYGSFGTTADVTSGLVIAMTISLAAGLALARSFPRRSWAIFALAAGAILLPSLVLLPGKLFAFLPTSSFTSRAVQLATGLGIGTILLGIPCTALGVWIGANRSQPEKSRSAMTPNPWAVALGLLFIPIWILPRLGALLAGQIAALGLVLLVLVERIRVDHRHVDSRSSSENRETPHVEASRSSLLSWTRTILLACLAGMMLAWTQSLIRQLWFPGLYCDLASLGGLVLGIAFPLGRHQDELARQSRRRTLAMALGAIAACLALADPFFVEGVLSINASISSGIMVLTIRALICAGLAAPSGMALRALLPARMISSSDAVRAILVCLGGGVGWSLYQSGIPSLTVGVGLILAFAVVVSFLEWPFRRTESFRHWKQMVPSAALLLLAALLIVRRETVNVALPANLLFSGKITAAFDDMPRTELLQVLDDSRLIETVEGRDSTWTVWKQRGAAVLFKENGQSRGATTLDPRLCPDSATDTLAAVLPLVVHQQCEHVLLSGLGSTTTAAVCLEFPIRTLTCLEPDQHLVQLAEQHVFSKRGRIDADPRYRCLPVSSLFARRTLPGGFDVVILNDPVPSRRSSRHEFTVESYREWSRQLAPQGILCQRLQFIDFGAEPIRTVAKTLQAVFPQVILWESAGGEVLFLASLSEEPLIRKDVLDRLSAGHTRRVLSHIGWDWSVPLSMIAIRSDRLQELTRADTKANSMANAHFGITVPGEIARWGVKWKEVHDLLLPHATPIYSWVDAPTEIEELNKRLADMKEQQSLSSRYPDNLFAYRAVLRSRLQERPRSHIVQVAHEGVKREMHPEDERRKEYLLQLGDAIRMALPQGHDPDALAQVRRLTNFTEPYDPLVSYFLHAEVARLLKTCAGSNPREQLDHWIHAVQYAPSHDQSVRPCIFALEILTEHPECVPEPLERWDLTNSLLETLKHRWHLRGASDKLTRFGPVDAQDSIEVAKKALKLLEKTGRQAGIDAEWCANRREVLDRGLIRPLRSYHARQTMRLKKLAERRAAKQRSNVRQNIQSLAPTF